MIVDLTKQYLEGLIFRPPGNPHHGNKHLWTDIHTFLERRIDKSHPNGCWVWQRALGADGYGHFRHEMRTYRVHRVMHALTHGVSQANLMVLHRCDNRACCNPDHIYAGTASDNNADTSRRSRHRARRGETNGKAKLTHEDVAKIRELAARGVANNIIAIEFGIHDGHVGRIVRKLQWNPDLPAHTALPPFSRVKATNQ